MLFLVVPEALRRGMTVRNDSLNAEVVCFKELGEKLVRQVLNS
jgi:hypothetical protein